MVTGNREMFSGWVCVLYDDFEKNAQPRWRHNSGTVQIHPKSRIRTRVRPCRFSHTPAETHPESSTSISFNYSPNISAVSRLGRARGQPLLICRDSSTSL